MVYRSLVWWVGRCSFAGLLGSMDDEDKLNRDSERIPCGLPRG